MPKLQLDVNELTEPEVNFVSLVKRGANRIPFRIVKEDNETMLDLAKVGRDLFKKADAAPAVVAALVRKGADLDKIKDRLSKAGLSVDHMEEKDDVVVFSQPNVTAQSEGVIKLDDDVGLVVSGIAKAFQGYDFENTTFGEVFATEGFYPSLSMAKSVLGYTVENIMSKADSPSEAASAIAKAVDDFKAYVTALAQKIPVQAFKADVTRITITHTAGAKDQPVEAAAAGKGSEGNAETPPEGVEKEEISESPEHGNPKGKTGDKAKPKPKDKDIEGSPTAGNPEGETGDQLAVQKAQLLKGVQDALASALGGLTTELEGALAGLKKDVAGIGGRLDQVEGKVTKAEEALKGTVIAGAGADQTVVRKDGGRNPPPLLDTAFMKLDAA